MNTGAWDPGRHSVYLKFMNSLDSAFMARRGMGNRSGDNWGEQFFDSFDEEYNLSDDEIVIIYAAASRLLNQFAARDEMEEYAWVFYQNPKSFGKTILMMVQNGLLP